MSNNKTYLNMIELLNDLRIIEMDVLTKTIVDKEQVEEENNFLRQQVALLQEGLTGEEINYYKED